MAMLVLLCLFTVCSSIPANDLCGGATVISDGTTTSSNLEATMQTKCVPHDVFFAYDPTCTGTATLKFHTQLPQVMTTTWFPGSHCSVLGNETSCQTSSLTFPISFKMSVNTGRLYYFAVGSASFQGAFNVTASCVSAPPNDLCTAALPITDGLTTGDNSLATNDAFQADIFWYYTATCTGTAVASFPVQKIVVGQLESCNKLYNPPSSLSGSLLFTVNEGRGYLLAVGSNWNYRGFINLTMHCLPQPAHDVCLGSLNITDGITHTSNVGASSQLSCVNNDIYFVYTATCNGTLMMTFSSQPRLTLRATQITTSCLAFFTCGPTLLSSVEAKVIQGQAYYVAVGFYQSPEQGNVSVSVVCIPAPAHDDCINALHITDGVSSANNYGATKQVSCLYADIWFYYTANCTGFVVGVFRGESNVRATIFESQSCTSVMTESCYVRTSEKDGKLIFAVKAGRSYYIAAGTASSSERGGALNVTMECHAAPPNDRCVGALNISDGYTRGAVTWATHKLHSKCTLSVHAIYFLYTATCSGSASAIVSALSPASGSTSVTVFTGTSCDALGAELVCTDYYGIEFPVVKGQGYYLSAGAAWGGDISLKLSCRIHPVNDYCQTALSVTDGVNYGDNIGASRHVRCDGDINADIFFYYVATCNGTVAITATPVHSNDTLKVTADFSSCSDILYRPPYCDTGNTEFEVTAGKKYYFAVGAQASYQGPIIVNVACHPPAANSQCAGALPLSDGMSQNYYRWSTSQHKCLGHAVLYFSYRASCTGTAIANFTSNGSYVTLRASQTRTCDAMPSASCDSDYRSPQASYDFQVFIGQVYYVAVGGDYLGYRGAVGASMGCYKSALYDTCERALRILDGVTIQASNVHASKQSWLRADIFFQYTATCDGFAQATIGPNDFKALLFSNYTCALGVRLSYDGVLQFRARAGETYYFAVGTEGTYRGLIDVTINCHSTPLNIICKNAVQLTDGLSIADSSWTTEGTSVITSLYFYYVPTCTGKVVASFRLWPSGKPLEITTFENCTTNFGFNAKCSTDFQFSAITGKPFYISIRECDNRSPQRGPMNISLQCVQGPVNDLCANAIEIIDGVGSGNNTFASSEVACTQNYGDIFFSYTGTCTGRAVATFAAATHWTSLFAAFIESGTCERIGYPTCVRASVLEFSAVLGKIHYLAVASSVYSDINVSVQCFEAPKNDNCKGALVVTDGEVEISNANSMINTRCLRKAVFFLYKATCTGRVTATVPTRMLATFSGSSCDALGPEIPCTADNKISFNAQSGSQHYFAAGQWVFADNSSLLRIKCEVLPPSTAYPTFPTAYPRTLRPSEITFRPTSLPTAAPTVNRPSSYISPDYSSND